MNRVDRVSKLAADPRDKKHSRPCCGPDEFRECVELAVVTQYQRSGVSKPPVRMHRCAACASALRFEEQTALHKFGLRMEQRRRMGLH